MSMTRQKGLSLIELMAGMVVGLVVLAGAFTVYVDSIKGQGSNLKLTRLNQDMRAMMDVMTRDIRRAGFMTSQPHTYFATLENNPFVAATTDIGIHDSGACIVYALNRDDDDPTIEENERYGFRLNGDQLQMRKYGATNANCSVIAEWETITEPEVEITALNFVLLDYTADASRRLDATSMLDTDHDGFADGDDDHDGHCETGEACATCTRDGSPDPLCVEVRSVQIQLSARLRDDTSVTQTINEEIRVRNDKIWPAIP